MTNPLEKQKKLLEHSDCLFQYQDILGVIDTMAESINRDFQDKHPIVICIMNGGLVFSGHLLTRLTMPLEVDYCHVTRYNNSTEGQNLLWRVVPHNDLNDRDILLLDDILDEGFTLHELIENCKKNGARSVTSAVLVNKQNERRPNEFNNANYSGITVPDRYVFGFGMDYHGLCRNLPNIYAIHTKDVLTKDA